MKKLYIKQKVFKITDHYQIYNQNEEALYQVDQDFKLIGNTVHVSDMSGEEIFVVDRELLTFLPRYSITFRNGKKASIEKQFTFFKKVIDINMDNIHLQAKGNFWDYKFEISNGDSIVASVEKVLLTWGDTYEITIYDESLEELIIGIVIAIDNIKDREKNN